MVWDAEKKGILRQKANRCLEASSGNNRIALCFVAASRGYPITITCNPAMGSIERSPKLMKALARPSY